MNPEPPPPEKIPPPPARILLVDDDPINQSVALGLLRRKGFDADSAANGKEALEKLAGKRFDLIFMDLQMPELDGFQTATIIRQNESERPSGSVTRETTDALRVTNARHSNHIPIIALTTASTPGTREKCIAAGMDDYLTKPIIPRDLFAAIEKHLGPLKQ